MIFTGLEKPDNIPITSIKNIVTYPVYSGGRQMIRLFHSMTGWVFWGTLFIIFSFCWVDGAGQDLSALIRSLDNPNPEVRYSAARKLSHMGPAAASAVPALVKALEDPDRQVQKEAMLALRSIGSPAVPALIGALKHNDPGVREEAVLALGKMGSAAHRAIPRPWWQPWMTETEGWSMRPNML